MRRLPARGDIGRRGRRADRHARPERFSGADDEGLSVGRRQPRESAIRGYADDGNVAKLGGADGALGEASRPATWHAGRRRWRDNPGTMGGGRSRSMPDRLRVWNTTKYSRRIGRHRAEGRCSRPGGRPPVALDQRTGEPWDIGVAVDRGGTWRHGLCDGRVRGPSGRRAACAASLASLTPGPAAGAWRQTRSRPR